MNKKGTLFILGIIFILVLAFFLIHPDRIINSRDSENLLFQETLYNSQKNLNLNQCDKSATTTNCEKNYSFSYDNWNIFKNIKYHYSILYPLVVNISTNNDYATNLNKEKSLEFFIPGKTNLIGIDIETIEPWQEEYFKTEKAKDYKKEFFEKNKKIISLDLKSYAEYIRNQQLIYKTSYENQKIVGELKEIYFADTKAYSFNLTKVFHFNSGGYVLPYGVFTYLITENIAGQKVIIHYLSGNEISEKMIQSFRFIDSSESPIPFSPFKNVYEDKEFGFSLKYPDELKISTPDCISLNDKYSDGTFAIKICNQNSPLSLYNPNFNSLDEYKKDYVLKTNKEREALRILIRKSEEITTSKGAKGLKQVIDVEIFDPVTGTSTAEMKDAFWYNQTRYVFYNPQKGVVELLMLHGIPDLKEAIIQSISF